MVQKEMLVVSAAYDAEIDGSTCVTYAIRGPTPTRTAGRTKPTNATAPDAMRAVQRRRQISTGIHVQASGLIRKDTPNNTPPHWSCLFSSISSAAANNANSAVVTWPN